MCLNTVNRHDTRNNTFGLTTDTKLGRFECTFRFFLYLPLGGKDPQKNNHLILETQQQLYR